MRLLHSADIHLGRTTHSSPGTTSRADDYAATLMRFADIACEEKVDVAILAGDVSHTRRPAPRDILALTSALRRLKDRHVTTIITSGNHDGPDAVGDPRTNAFEWMSVLPPTDVHVLTKPFSHFLHYDTKAFGVVAIPYPHRRSYDALMPEIPPDERTEEISKRLENYIETMYDKVSEMGAGHEPIIFVGHLSTLGAKLGTEVTMRFGWDVAIRAALLDRFDYAALGHIHRQQQVGASSWYSGSPEMMDFGEEGQPKGFLLAEVERGKPPKVTVIDSKPRPMMTIEVRRNGDAWQGNQFERVKDAIVRLRVYPDPATQADVKVEVNALVKEYREHGASHVQSEVILPEHEAAIRVAVDPNVEAAEALRRWLTANEHDVEPALSAGIELINSIGAGE